MKREYDFSNAKRGPVLPAPTGKTRITIRLDDDVTEWFLDQVERASGGNYQSLINNALRDHMERSRSPPETTLLRVIREEIRRTGCRQDDSNKHARMQSRRFRADTPGLVAAA